jgi:cytidylate kinase
MTEVLAIDGPSGSGKSTVAKRLARELGFNYLDTGATYRAFGYFALLDADNLDDDEEVLDVLDGFDLEYRDESVFVNGRDVTDKIRTDRVSQAASKVAQIKDLRRFLVKWQKEWVSKNGPSVVEGRDATTVVFPEAKLKIFLTADDKVRSLRRSIESQQDLKDVEKSLAERDGRDSNRAESPLMVATDAVVIDSSSIGIDQVVEEILSLWKNLNP